MIKRDICTICDCSLTQISEYKDHVLSYSPTIIPSDNSSKISFPVGYCKNCCSIQLMLLIPPSILYKNSHNETFNTPIWQDHHTIFYSFFSHILLDINTCIEIGGAQCILANKIIKDYPLLNYTVLDIIEHPLGDIKVEIGNCENYVFFQDCVILSHVFEHLHDPKVFLQNIKDSPVNYVIMSIPNLEYMIENRHLYVINIEHTFYYNNSHINKLFNDISFHCIKTAQFKDHSLFYIFERSKESPYTSITNIYSHSNSVYNHFSDCEIRLNKISLNIINDICIAPAGYYGYIIYSYLISIGYKDLIKFAVDNDKSKHGKYMSGTDICIRPYDELINRNNITIIVYTGIHTKDIISQILRLNSNVTVITI